MAMSEGRRLPDFSASIDESGPVPEVVEEVKVQPRKSSLMTPHTGLPQRKRSVTILPPPEILQDKEEEAQEPPPDIDDDEPDGGDLGIKPAAAADDDDEDDDEEVQEILNSKLAAKVKGAKRPVTPPNASHRKK